MSIDPSNPLPGAVEDAWADFARSLRRRGGSDKTTGVYRQVFTYFWRWPARLSPAISGCGPPFGRSRARPTPNDHDGWKVSWSASDAHASVLNQAGEGALGDSDLIQVLARDPDARLQRDLSHAVV
jgi:hypothetical protein